MIHYRIIYLPSPIVKGLGNEAKPLASLAKELGMNCYEFWGAYVAPQLPKGLNKPKPQINKTGACPVVMARNSFKGTRYLVPIPARNRAREIRARLRKLKLTRD